ncbi:MAG: baseplate J/gp47 family protein [Ruminococcaceae bacterium]|nr:baseplate J/gp47 family protein [Oscillospiraceae bacterium]
MKTTKELYEAMLEGIKARSGFAADDSCDLAVRLYAAAAQLESLYAYADWSRRQCFPHTADGEYLDLHAEIHGLSRDAATHAVGTLTLGLAQTLGFALSIPAGTLFCVPNGVSFRLTEDCRISAGSRSGEAKAECTEAGIQGNVAAGEITGMVEAPTYISFVVNSAAFAGGREAETDEHLRQRVLRACRAMPNGANSDYYEAVALAQEGITSAAAIPAYLGEGTVALCISGDYGSPNDSHLDAVRKALKERTELGVLLQLMKPIMQAVDVTLKVWPVDGVSTAEAIEAARSAIEACFERPMLRQGFYRSQAGSLIYNTGLVKNYEFIQPENDRLPGQATLYTLGSLQITEGE